MNARAEDAGFVTSAAAEHAEIVFTALSLEVRIPTVAHMLAMKVARFAGDADIEDAKSLLSKLGTFTDLEDVWTCIGGLVPVAGRAQARHNLESLWEMTHEPA